MLAIVLISILCMVTGSAAESHKDQVDERRPIWNIGHMVNAVSQVDQFLELGANAIEADLQFYTNGTLDRFYHGFPCDAFRVCTAGSPVAEYLQNLHQRIYSEPGSPLHDDRLALFYIDLKAASLRTDNAREVAGRQLAEALQENLFSVESDQSLSNESEANNEVDDHRGLNVIIAAQHIQDEALLRGFVNHFEDRELMNRWIGFDISEDQDYETIKSVYYRLNVTNVWQSHGQTNWLPHNFRWTDRLVTLRDFSETEPYFSKICLWTVDSRSTIRRSIE